MTPTVLPCLIQHRRQPRAEVLLRLAHRADRLYQPRNHFWSVSRGAQRDPGSLLYIEGRFTPRDYTAAKKEPTASTSRVVLQMLVRARDPIAALAWPAQGGGGPEKDPTTARVRPRQIPSRWVMTSEIPHTARDAPAGVRARVRRWHRPLPRVTAAALRRAATRWRPWRPCDRGDRGGPWPATAAPSRVLVRRERCRRSLKDVAIRRYISERGKIDPRRKSAPAAKPRACSRSPQARALHALLPYTAATFVCSVAAGARCGRGPPPPSRPPACVLCRLPPALATARRRGLPARNASAARWLPPREGGAPVRHRPLARAAAPAPAPRRPGRTPSLSQSRRHLTRTVRRIGPDWFFAPIVFCPADWFKEGSRRPSDRIRRQPDRTRALCSPAVGAAQSCRRGPRDGAHRESARSRGNPLTQRERAEEAGFPDSRPLRTSAGATTEAQQHPAQRHIPIASASKHRRTKALVLGTARRADTRPLKRNNRNRSSLPAIRDQVTPGDGGGT